MHPGVLKNKMQFSKTVLTIFLVVILIGVGLFLYLSRKGETISSEDASVQSSSASNKPEETPLPVKVDSVRNGELVLKLKSPGEAVTNKRIQITAEVQGAIQSLNVEESLRVDKGYVMVEIDDAEYKLTLERHEADRLRYLSEFLLEEQFADPQDQTGKDENQDLLKSKQEYEKARQLFRQGKISEAEFEDIYQRHELLLIRSGEMKEKIRAAAKGLTQAEIQVQKAKIDLEKTNIKAPYSGIITDIRVSPQEQISIGRELFTLVNIDNIQVHAKVLESEIAKMRVGREVDLRFSAYTDRIFKGKVKAISPVVDPEDKTCRVIVDMPNPDEQIKPGMHAEVEIAADIYQNRLIIPQEAILSRGGRKLAFVVEAGLAKWRYIKVGLENEEYAEVLEGLEEEEIVIIEGHFTLAHDARVRIVK
jgi:RND family efflux transporter MFP subunit